MNRKLISLSAVVMLSLCSSASGRVCTIPQQIKQMTTSNVCKTSHRMYKLLNGLPNFEAFKAYCLGIKKLLGFEHRLTKEALTTSIQNHLFYLTDDGVNQIWETKGEAEQAHFFLKHRCGIRHFTIQVYTVGESEFFALKNATIHFYPTISRFLGCTLSP